MRIDTIEDALRALAAGGMVVVVDDEDRENEGDLIMAASLAESASIAFMVRYSSGVLCVPLPADRLRDLAIPIMVPRNMDVMETAFTVTVDYRFGTTTGISAEDRAVTIRALVDPKARALDFNRPGHVFPLRAVDGGVLRRPGHTEAAVDLTRLAGLEQGGVIGELVNDDGSMMRGEQLKAFAQRHGLPCVTIADLITYRLRHDPVPDADLVAPAAFDAKDPASRIFAGLHS